MLIDCVDVWLLIVLVLYIDGIIETCLFIYCYFDGVVLIGWECWCLYCLFCLIG